MLQLTLAGIKRAKRGATLYDREVAGYHARVGERGPVFYYRYRFGGKERRRSIGSFPTLSIEDGRGIARKWAKALAEGIDPHTAVIGLPTVADLKTRWDLECAPHKKRSSQKMDSIHWNVILKEIGDRPVASITHDDVSLIHAHLVRLPVKANRTIALLSTAMNRAELWRMRRPGDNPCRFITRYREKKRRRVMRIDEAQRVCAALRAQPPRFAEHVAWILLLVITGARKNEFRFSKFADIRETGAGYVIDFADSKTDEKTIQLPAAAMHILRETCDPKWPRLFRIRSVDYFWGKVLKAAKVEDLHIHDLRRTFATVGLSGGFSLSQMGQLLGHASAQTTMRYAYLMDDKAAQAASKTADAILALMEGSGDGGTPDR